MKRLINTKKLFAAALFLVAGTLQTFANEYDIIWVKADVYPTGAGTVYLNWNKDDEKVFAESSEFKRHTNGAISTAYIWTQPAEGYLFSGVSRDSNGDGMYFNKDTQVKVDADGFFSAYKYPGSVEGSSSSEAEEKAKEELAKKTEPSDHIFAVFTKGDVSRVAAGQETCGHAYADNLDPQVGSEVTFSAYGDSKSTDDGTKYYIFDHWTNAEGTTVGTARELKVTVVGMAIYYAHFKEVTKDEFNASGDKDDPHKFESSSGGLGISDVKADQQAGIGIYNLNGQRVEQPAKGIYIMNGKKVIKK